MPHGVTMCKQILVHLYFSGCACRGHNIFWLLRDCLFASFWRKSKVDLPIYWYITDREPVRPKFFGALQNKFEIFKKSSLCPISLQMGLSRGSFSEISVVQTPFDPIRPPIFGPLQKKFEIFKKKVRLPNFVTGVHFPRFQWSGYLLSRSDT